MPFIEELRKIEPRQTLGILKDLAKQVWQLGRQIVMLCVALLKCFAAGVRYVWRKIIKPVLDFYFKRKEKIDLWAEGGVGVLIIAMASLNAVGQVISAMPKSWIKGAVVIALCILLYRGTTLLGKLYIKLQKALCLSKNRVVIWSKNYLVYILFMFIANAFLSYNPVGTVFGMVGDKVPVMYEKKGKIYEVGIASGTGVKNEAWASYRRKQDDLKVKFMYLPSVENSLRWAAKKVFPGLNFMVDIVIGLAQVESGFYCKAVSEKGALGLMQVLNPGKKILAEAQKILGHPVDLFRAKDNAVVGCLILRNKIQAMDGNLMLGILAYNVKYDGLGFVIQRYVRKPLRQISITEVTPYMSLINQEHEVGAKTFVYDVLAGGIMKRARDKHLFGLKFQEGRNAEKIQRLGIPGVS